MTYYACCHSRNVCVGDDQNQHVSLGPVEYHGEEFFRFTNDGPVTVELVSLSISDSISIIYSTLLGRLGEPPSKYVLGVNDKIEINLLASDDVRVLMNPAAELRRAIERARQGSFYA